MLLNVFDTICEEYINIVILFFNIFILIVLISSLIFVRNSRKRWSKVTDYLGDVTKTVNSVRYGDLTKKINKLGIAGSENLTESLNRMIETLKDRESMIEEFQKDLIKQNKILENTLNSLSEGLLIVNTGGEILRATPLVAHIFEFEGKNLIGHSLFDFIKIETNKPLQQWKEEDVLIHSKKDSNFLASSVKLNIEGKKELYIVILKDVTNQRELETLKEDFVATLTHDLKVPIIAETNMIELFLNESFGTISDKQKLALKNMQTSNKELLELVQTVLETYKVGKIKLYKENIMLKEFITEIVEEMTPIAAKNKNSLVFEPSRDIRISADRFQIKRVIKNLIQNAISYGKPNTQIEITIGEIPDYTIIKVKDYGDGISKTDIDRIFNKYYSAAKKFRKIGTGLGLYLSLQILKAHNGDLKVESTEGEFTEFCIQIPIDYEHTSIPY